MYDIKPRLGPAPTGLGLGQAMNALDDTDTARRDQRAQELVEDFDGERHDADDDADEGGEG